MKLVSYKRSSSTLKLPKDADVADDGEVVEGQREEGLKLGEADTPEDEDLVAILYVFHKTISMVQDGCTQKNISQNYLWITMIIIKGFYNI